MLISEAFRFYEKDKKLLNYSINTLKAYSLQVKLLIKHLGDIEISEITYVQLKEYLIQQEHLKPASLGHRIRFVRSFFRYLHEEDFIQKNVSSKLKEPKMGARIPKSFSEEELELLRDGCSTIIQRLLIEFFYATGCRISEVNNVNIVDINWQDRSIRVIG
ncbi:MAG TPA: integrase, partial [Spirochaetia bacterium]|nr:integrase [Spirochaetia bacterium]